MLKNYFKIIIRNLLKQKINSLIHVAGFAIGIACALLILLWVQHELSYDKYHKNAKHIYRIITEDTRDNKIQADSPFRLAPELKQLYPGILEYARFSHYWEGVIKYNSKIFNENRLIYADPSLFNIFSWKLLKGNSATALDNPNSVIITQSMAQKYFGHDDPMGKALILDNEKELLVTGIIEDIPQNSHFKFDFLLPISEIHNKFGDWLNNWSCIEFNTYLLLDEALPASELQAKLIDFEKRYIDRGLWQFSLQALTDIHLHSSDLRWEHGGRGNIEYVTIFSAIAVLILLIACLNYMNLATARSTLRTKEIGIRRTVGSSRIQLVYQFLGESLILSLFGLIIAFLLAELALPVFNGLVGEELDIPYGNYLFHLIMISIALGVGIIAGSYPAFVLSSLNVVRSLKGESISVTEGINFRKLAVVFQFTISIILIVGTIVIYRQLQFVQSRNLGFNKEQLISIKVQDSDRVQSYERYKNAISQNVNILSVSAATSVPPNRYQYTSVYPEGIEGEERWNWTMKSFFVDYSFIQMMGMEIIEGRDFSKELLSDKNGAIIINEAAVQALGWTSAIGKKLVNSWDNQTATVIGVVRDFHFKSLKDPIEPAFLKLYSRWVGYVVVRIRPQNIPTTLAFLENKWNEQNPEWPFTYHFIDESFENLYQSEKRLGQLIGIFSGIAIFIACLGFFSLSLFTIERRTKEIGIRKILGASVSGMMAMLSTQFTKWVLLANIIAWPIAWFTMNKWLQSFAYRIKIDWWVFALAGGLTLLVALLTVSWQAIRAAMANPVKNLRYE